jgi:FAD/FMN-containing dehydrogenase
MERLVSFAHRFGTDVLAGSSNTVSVGGYISGGGHSKYSGLYGLAADAVLQVEMVTPSGEVVIANECQNTDLFWAVRGVSSQPTIPQCWTKSHVDKKIHRAAAVPGVS